MPYKFSSFEVAVGPPGEERSIVATWTRASAEFEAVLVRSGGRPACRSLTVRDGDGVAQSVRRLPSDTDIVAAIGQQVNGGSAYLMFVMDESLHVDLKRPTTNVDEAGFATDNNEMVSVTEELLSAKLVTFHDELQRRARLRQPALIDMAAKLLAENTRTSDVATTLMARGYVSESTAYRAIAQARLRVHRGE